VRGSLSYWPFGGRGSAQDLAHKLGDFGIDQQASVIGRNRNVANSVEVLAAGRCKTITLSGH
jgi:hypothetical protein